MKRFLSILTLILIGATAAVATEKTLDFENQEIRINYSLGYQIGGDFKRQGVNMNPEAIVQGIQDALAEHPPKIPAEEMRATLIALKEKVVADQKDRFKNRMAELVEQSKVFLEENKKKDGIITTATGLQYKVIEPGSGETPKTTDKVTVNYRGMFVDGQEFDSSFKRGKPATFELDKVIKGWTEGLQLIKEGGKLILFIPPELAYGEKGPMANQALIFDIELLSLNREAEEKPAITTGGKSPTGKE